jgi:hypothetical protein
MSTAAVDVAAFVRWSISESVSVSPSVSVSKLQIRIRAVAVSDLESPFETETETETETDFRENRQSLANVENASRPAGVTKPVASSAQLV